MEWKLELVPIPVSDVDRAKSFYTDKVGFNIDHDVRALRSSSGATRVRLVRSRSASCACAWAERGWPVFEISAATHEGLTELTYALAMAVQQHRASLPPPDATRIVLRPKAVDDGGFTVEVDPDNPDGFVVRGERPSRWVRQTDFSNDEAVGYLADRLARLGVEEALVKAGAQAGAEVTIGDVSFDWQPTLAVAAAIADGPLPGPRGTDVRVETNNRTSSAERLVAYREEPKSV